MTFKDYNGPWPWKYFTLHEIACKCCGEVWQGEEMSRHFITSMDSINTLRTLYGRPIVLTCGHRCCTHNLEVGGVKSSSHLQLAFDCVCRPADIDKFVTMAMRVGFNGIGIYNNRGFVHLDIRKNATFWRG